MNLAETRERFLVALCGWCADEFARERDAGFQTLLSMKNPTARRTVAVLQSFPRERQDTVLAAMLHWAHQRPGADVPLPRRDRAALGELQRKMEQLRVSEPPAPPRPARERATVRRQIREALSAARLRLAGGGADDVVESSGVLRFRRHVGEFVVTTIVELNTNLWDVSYLQRVRIPEGPQLIEKFSWALGLGVTNADQWAAIPASEASEVANVIVQLSERVVNAMPALLGVAASGAD